ncbi:lipopolysaccharide biosynthesis protein [Sphingomonas sp. Leaf357]|uniref:GumC family protein n=1 Tax=Sphingomonas sp. Leaf357 TaxID=1736350 RepID=UPI0006FC3062|nr:Wzz/FepE/Etk N-terminal domain-containing protein [Sphingomonas sp. Leaf357]KQS04176.1 lipopolysaccharide biosynthesis protein [Sphingomonas sp. Leaf357]
MTDGSGYTAGQEEQSSSILGSLPLILWQRKWFVIVPAVIIAFVATAAAFLLPRSYESSALLLVESQNLPGGTTAGPADDVIDRRIAKIRQQILARPDLVELIQNNNLYNVSSRSEPLSELVDRMRNATEISAVDASITRGAAGAGGSGSIAFSLKFDYPRAPEAQIVAQTFVDRLLKLDQSESQSQAQTNVRFLEDQQTSLQAQVDAIEAQVNRVTGQNGAALSSGSGMGMITIGGGDFDSQIAALRRENLQLQQQSGTAGVGRDAGVVAAEAQLAAAKAQYSDDHPDVKLAETRLAAAKTAASQFQTNNVASSVQKQIAQNNQAIAELTSARGQAQGRAATMAAAQARGPVVAQQVSQLQARADQIRTDLGKVTSNLLNARSMAKLTEEQRGERLTLIDPPVTPDKPTKPNRPLFVIGGIVGGLAVGIALAFLIELVHRPIRNVATLTNITGVPPLAVVPVLSKKRARAGRRWSWRRKKKAEPTPPLTDEGEYA